jgi:hypothetical protein
MQIMARFRGVPQYASALAGFCLALCLSLTQGCARSEPVRRTDAGLPASEQKLPFHPETDHALDGEGTRPAVPPDPKMASGLPFRTGSHPRILPSGTLLTVQLEGSLSTANVRPGDAFTASVAAPLAIDGDTLIERGTTVTGRIESVQSQAQRPGLVRGSGYFGLTLSAMTVEGRQFALQTSSLFTRGTLRQANVSSRGSPVDLRSEGVRVPKGRRLTFRLTLPVKLDDPNSTANRQSPGPATE